MLLVSGRAVPPPVRRPAGDYRRVRQYWCSTITEALQSDAFQQRAEEAARPILYGDCELSRQGAVGTLETCQENRELLREIGLDVPVHGVAGVRRPILRVRDVQVIFRPAADRASRRASV